MRFSAGYVGLPGVRALLLTGSVARGWADRYSDIELMLFWDGPPTEPLRRRGVEAGGGLPHAFHGYDPDNAEWADDVLVDGVEVQVSHRDVAHTGDWLADVTQRYDPSLVKQDLIALIEYGVPLHGAPLIDAWRQRCTPYPPQLALAMVRQHLDFQSTWQRRKLLARRDLLPLYTDLLHTAHQVVLILLGLNRVYFPHLGFKWLPQLTADLKIAPPDVTGKLQVLLTAAPHTAVQVADALIAETLQLVAAHLPNAGATDELALLHHERPTWDQPPPSTKARR